MVFLGSLWLLLWIGAKPSTLSIGRAMVLGLLLGILSLEKPVLFWPALGAAVWRFGSARKALIGMAAGYLMISIPWAVRGYLRFGELTFTKTFASAMTFPVSWTRKLAAHPRYTVSDSLEKFIESLFLLPEGVSIPHYRAATRVILEAKGHLLPERTLFHAYIYWTIPPRYWGNWSLAFLAVRLIPLAILSVLTVWGGDPLAEKSALAVGGRGSTCVCYAFLLAQSCAQYRL